MLEKRLAELGIVLPASPKPLAAYVPARRSGNLVFVSGQLPLLDGQLLMTGPVRSESGSVEAAQAAMRQCFLNALAAAGGVVDLNSLRSVLRLGAFVVSGSDFTEQHIVANGASQVAVDIFGEDGRHARAAVGVSALPLNAAVELEVLFEVSP